MPGGQKISQMKYRHGLCGREGGGGRPPALLFGPEAAVLDRCRSAQSEPLRRTEKKINKYRNTGDGGKEQTGGFLRLHGIDNYFCRLEFHLVSLRVRVTFGVC